MNINKSTIYFLLFALAFACKPDKTEPETVKNEREYFMGKKWKLSKWTVSPPLDNDSNLLETSEKCILDNTYTFKDKDSLEYNDEDLKCMPSDPQIIYSNWKVFNDSFKMFHTTYSIKKLDDTQFELKSLQFYATKYYLYTIVLKSQ